MKTKKLAAIGVVLGIVLSLVLGACTPQTPAKGGEPAENKKAVQQPAAKQKAAEKPSEPTKKGIKDIKIGYRKWV